MKTDKNKISENNDIQQKIVGNLREEKKLMQEVFDATSTAILVADINDGSTIMLNKTMRELLDEAGSNGVEQFISYLKANGWLITDDGNLLHNKTVEIQLEPNIFIRCNISVKQLNQTTKQMVELTDIAKHRTHKLPEKSLGCHEAQNMINYINDLICKIDENGRFLYANKQYEYKLGYLPEQLIGSNVNDLLHPDDLVAARKKHQQQRKQLKESTDIWRFKHKNGKWLWFECRSSYMKNAENNVETIVIATDITEQYINQQKIRDTIQKFNAIISTIGEGITFSDYDGFFEVYNRQMEVITGYTKIEANRTRHFLELLYPKPVDRININRQILRLKKDGVNKNIETQIVSKSGERKTLLVTSTITEIDGNTYFLSVYRDITLRKQANMALQESEEQYRLLFNNMLNGFTLLRILFDDNQQPVDAMYLDVNRAFENLFNLKKEQVIGKTQRELFGNIDPLLSEKFAEVAINQENISFEYHVKVIDKYVEIFAYSPKKKHFATVFNDITDRKKAEIALRKSEEKYRLIANNVDDVIWLMDRNFKYTYVSPSIEKLTGYRVNEYMKFSFEQYIEKKSLIEIQNAIMKRLQSERAQVKDAETRIWTHQYIHRDGYLLWVETTTRPLHDEEGKFKGLIGITRNIAERKAAEEALKESEENLRELNATKDKFFSIVAHDLKNPFHTILGLSELLLERLHRYDHQKIEHYVKHIRDASDAGHNLLENLLEWSRSQTGRIAFAPESVAMKEFIKEKIKPFTTLASQKRIKLYFSNIPDVCAYADKNMLETILRNLVSNAIKFTHPKGSVMISVFKAVNKVQVSVIDTGIGIQEKHKKDLFRIDEHRTTQGTANEKGTGLGLILCKEFVERNGGSIYVESQVDKGSKFTFTLPSA